MLQVVVGCIVLSAVLLAEADRECVILDGRRFCTEDSDLTISSALPLPLSATRREVNSNSNNNSNLFTSAPIALTSNSSGGNSSSNLFTSRPIPVESNIIPDAAPLLSNRDTSSDADISSLISDIFASPSTTAASSISSTALDDISFQVNNSSSERPDTFNQDNLPGSASEEGPVSEVTDSIFYPVTVPVLQSTTSANNDLSSTLDPFENSEVPTEKPTTKPIVVSINKLIPDRHTCGFQNESERFPDFHLASLDEFPWVVLLRYRYADCDAGFRCTGTLINDRYVLTAAHCVHTEPELFYLHSVRLGEWDISQEKDCDPLGEGCADKVIDLKIEKKTIHPHFSPRYRNDNIALLRLEKSVKYTTFIRPICLPVENLFLPDVGTILITSGWGTTRYGSQLNIKSKMYVPVIHKEHCKSSIYASTKFFHDQACFGFSKRQDFCKTDDGGALMTVDDTSGNQPQWYLEGVISKGYGCNTDNMPGIYTRVTNYVNWMLQTIAHDIV